MPLAPRNFCSSNKTYIYLKWDTWVSPAIYLSIYLFLSLSLSYSVQTYSLHLPLQTQNFLVLTMLLDILWGAGVSVFTENFVELLEKVLRLTGSIIAGE